MTNSWTKWANLNTLEHERFDNFYLEHVSCRNRAKNFKGVDLRITPTGIGTVFTVKCPHCKIRENITDYNKW